MVGVEQWAEIRRLHRVEGLSIREISRRTGLHRKTVRRALAAAEPPRYSRAAAGRSSIRSRTGSVSSWRRIRGSSRSGCGRWPASSAMRAGSRSSTTIVREVRPRFLRAADVPADGLSAGRAGPVRSVGAARADPGRSWAAPSRLGGDLRGVLVAGDRRHAGVQQGGAGHPVRAWRGT